MSLIVAVIQMEAFICTKIFKHLIISLEKTTRYRDVFCTCASGLFDPKDAAPNLTTSANWIMVDTAFWAATASCS